MSKSYSDVLIKKDLYEEYRNEIDRYKPIEEIQKEMKRINLKYILHTYLRVRNLCDQGIDDPHDVAEILNIPFYIADDLVNEYFLIPEKFDKRTIVFSDITETNIESIECDPRMAYLQGLPYAILPVNFLGQTDVNAVNTTVYAMMLSFSVWKTLGRNNLINLSRDEQGPWQDDELAFKGYQNDLIRGDNSILTLDYNSIMEVFNMLPVEIQTIPWIDETIKTLFKRLTDTSWEHKSVDPNLRKQFPGYKPAREKLRIVNNWDITRPLFCHLCNGV